MLRLEKQSHFIVEFKTCVCTNKLRTNALPLSLSLSVMHLIYRPGGDLKCMTRLYCKAKAHRLAKQK
jgi:hypothetical protein